MSVAENGRSLALAEELLAVGDAPLGERDLKQIRNLVLDHLGCCYAGSLLAWGRRMHEWAAPHAGSGNAPLLASQTRLAPGLAAFVNATAAHGLELDDTHDESVSHPGAAVIASSLALAAHHGLSGERLAAAIYAGYEAVGRVGAATNAAETIELGFHPTSLFVGFGAAAAAAVLMNLSPKELARGWGLVLSMAGGSMQFSQEPEGTTVKRLHGGYAALHGVMAAEHAGLGIAGPEQALEGRYGLISNFGADSDPERLNRPHPDGPEIHRISYKPYPCCRLFHSTLDALAEVTGNFSLDPQEIESIVVGGPDIMVTQHMLRRPTSEMAAQYSLPFTLGAALYYGPASVAGFMGDALEDSRTLAIADRVDAVADPDMQAAFPAHFGSWLELKDRNGDTRRSDVLDSLGTPANPMGRAELLAKFDSLTTGDNGIDGAEIAARLDNLQQLRLIDPLLASFCK
ncbi:MAG: MmgE/PrpD family protein [Gammaproteobacteria bacterium]|nr:MmgE/PrpD family protein [Gammaproteobacteria bacterium]